MSMFGPRAGCWYVQSVTDPRWNKSGRGMGLVMSGGPEELKEWLTECKTKYGEAPADCTMGFMKD